jgi:hypothetical protein
MQFTTYLHLGPNLKTLANTLTAPLRVCFVFNSVHEELSFSGVKSTVQLQ